MVFIVDASKFYKQIPDCKGENKGDNTDGGGNSSEPAVAQRAVLSIVVKQDLVGSADKQLFLQTIQSFVDQKKPFVLVIDLREASLSKFRRHSKLFVDYMKDVRNSSTVDSTQVHVIIRVNMVYAKLAAVGSWIMGFMPDMKYSSSFGSSDADIDAAVEAFFNPNLTCIELKKSHKDGEIHIDNGFTSLVPAKQKALSLKPKRPVPKKYTPRAAKAPPRSKAVPPKKYTVCAAEAPVVSPRSKAVPRKQAPRPGRRLQRPKLNHRSAAAVERPSATAERPSATVETPSATVEAVSTAAEPHVASAPMVQKTVAIAQ